MRLSVEERREAVRELTAPTENGGSGLSTRAAAEVLGVDEKTARNDLRSADSSADGASRSTRENTPDADISAPEPDPLTMAALEAVLPEDARDRLAASAAIEALARWFAAISLDGIRPAEARALLLAEVPGLHRLAEAADPSRA